MSKWAERLALLNAETPQGRTDETDTTGVPSVLSVAPGGAALKSKSAPARTCRPCQHRARHGNCTEPEAAGLWERFILVWAPEGHAATCPAYLERAPMRTP